MKRIWLKREIYSNCLVYAIYLMFRLKRPIRMVTIPKHKTIHFYVKKGNYCFDFHPMNNGLSHMEQLLFKGTCRIRNRRGW